MRCERSSASTARTADGRPTSTTSTRPHPPNSAEQEKSRLNPISVEGRAAMGFDGKVAIVTGAARSLGQDYASFFAREGARVVVADIATDPACAHAEKLNADGAEAIAVTVDVGDEASTLAMAEAVNERFGR